MGRKQRGRRTHIHALSVPKLETVHSNTDFGGGQSGHGFVKNKPTGRIYCAKTGPKSELATTHPHEVIRFVRERSLKA